MSHDTEYEENDDMSDTPEPEKFVVIHLARPRVLSLRAASPLNKWGKVRITICMSEAEACSEAGGQ